MIKYYQKLLRECKNIARWKITYFKMLLTLLIMKIKFMEVKKWD